jgi:amino acid adenylation domain-containing protein
LFEEQARTHPDAVAVVCEDRQYTYDELNRRANRIAHWLRARGAGKGARVAIYMDRGIDGPAAILGALKAGAAYVPLDPTHPADRTASLIAAARPAAIILHPALPFDATVSGIATLMLGGQEDTLASCPDADSVDAYAKNDLLAYIIYTSGSTGVPKGVMLEHRSVVNLWHASRERIWDDLGEGLRVSLNASLAFDASVKMWIQLLSGHTLVVVPQAVRQDPERLIRYIGEQRIDVLDCTPAQLDLLLALGFPCTVSHSVRAVLVGGEAIRASLWERLAAIDTVQFHNMYGPTECCVNASTRRISRGESPNLGHPLRNLRMHLLDRHLQPVPVGVVGEIHIGGEGVARGYFERPDLTTERFVADPHSHRTGSILYKSGDLGRYRHDGTIEYLGRNDFQVKVRGFRLELQEVEAALLAHPGCCDAAVIGEKEGDHVRRLIAYVVLADAETSLGDLRTSLARSLPDYMLPSIYVVMDALPLTTNAKLDRKALPPPARHHVVDDDKPCGGIEATIAGIWREALNLTHLDGSCDFFALGGDSLSAMRVTLRIRETCGVAVTLKDVFEHPLLADLARFVEVLQYSTYLSDGELSILTSELGSLTEQELLDLLSGENT